MKELINLIWTMPADLFALLAGGLLFVLLLWVSAVAVVAWR